MLGLPASVKAPALAATGGCAVAQLIAPCMKQLNIIQTSQCKVCGFCICGCHGLTCRCSRSSVHCGSQPGLYVGICSVNSNPHTAMCVKGRFKKRVGKCVKYRRRCGGALQCCWNWILQYFTHFYGERCTRTSAAMAQQLPFSRTESRNETRCIFHIQFMLSVNWKTKVLDFSFK